MNHTELRRALTALGLSARFTVADLGEALAHHRGRPLRLRPVPLPAQGLTGGLLVTDDIDFIAFQQDTTRLHQDHIVCHEFGHILAGHQMIDVRGLNAARLLAPNIDPAVVRRLLNRVSFADRQEREAEDIAEVLMSRHITHWTDRGEWIMPTSAPLFTQRLLDSFGPGER